MVRITHQRAKCIGCYYCAAAAPGTWTMNEDDGKATLRGAKEKKGFYTTTVTDDEYAANLEAAESCPVNIIKIEKYS